MSLFSRVKDWGYRVGIFEEENIVAQFFKLKEEVEELWPPLVFLTQDDIPEAIGKTLLHLNILCHMTGNDPDDCLRLALNEIEKRKEEENHENN